VASQSKATKKPKRARAFDPEVFLSTNGLARIASQYQPEEKIFAQDEKGDAVFYIQSGSVKLSVVSKQGKEAIVAMLGAGDFVGETCLTGHETHMASATAMEPSSILKIGRDEMQSKLEKEPALAARFITYLLSRNLRIEQHLVDQLFNSTEKRLARILLLLARYGTENEPHMIVPSPNQATLAKMLGVTRERVNFFMNKFRKMGFIDYNGSLKIHSSLMSVVLQD
jgi:CRP/FNR family transcriptional regulator, cyclic AMP receptor protein